LPACAYVGGRPAAAALLRHQPDDFRVDELLGFEPDGDGEHAWLLIRKRGHNTHWLAAALARLAGIRERDVGFAGLKDRHAETTQWFSVALGGRREPDWRELESDTIRVLRVERHRRKLRRGTLRGNHFMLHLRDLSGDSGDIRTRLERIKRYGAPNYFGEQRFGRDNIARARAMFTGQRRVKQRQRSLYLSAARSLLFNEVLSRRVTLGNWDRGVPGDVMQLAGSNSIFAADIIDADIEQRLERFDIHPSGPLWGCGSLPTSARAQTIEADSVTACTDLCRGLEEAGLRQQRRPLRVVVDGLDWELSGTDLVMAFSLPAGSYATVVLREIVRYYCPVPFSDAPESGD
jgi:tRNA pseudouridine13 synthase